MKKLDNVLRENPYLRECRMTVFTSMLCAAFVDNPNLDKIKDKSFAHGLICYPPQWTSKTDIFQYLDTKTLKGMQSNEIFFVFDASTEGFSPTTLQKPFFDLLYHNCQKYHVHPQQIIYTSANLKDEENIQQYNEKHGITKSINVFSFPSFERVLTYDDGKDNEAMEMQYRTAYQNNVEMFNGKYFSSLSRINRYFRTIATFLVSNSRVADKALISHDKLDPSMPEVMKTRVEGLADVNPDDIDRWYASLPQIVDHANFNRNWALDTPYRHIHDQTLFQIVNETCVDHLEGTVMFYSEKTFRPIAHFQPMIIYGNPGANRYLKKIGYKTYEDWFDFSFDDIEDPIERYKKLLESVENTCDMLDSMTQEEKIAWRFKNVEILQHNFMVMIHSTYAVDKLAKLVIDMDRKHESN